MYETFSMKYLQFVFALLTVVVLACNNPGTDHKKKITATVDNTVAPDAGGSIMQLDGRLKDVDSLVFIFYKDPHGTDSLRYTRFYKDFHSTDTALIALVQNSLHDSVERLERVRPCRSEGKIWCFRRGDIFQTIYFSAHNKDCSFVYIIKNGQFYYSKLAGNLATKLAELKGLAKEPKVEQR